MQRPRASARRAAACLRRYDGVIARYASLMRSFSAFSGAHPALGARTPSSSAAPHAPSPAAATRAMAHHVAHVTRYLCNATSGLRRYLTRLSCDASLVADVGGGVLSFAELQKMVGRVKVGKEKPTDFEGVMKGLIDRQKYPLLNNAFRIHREYAIDGTGRSIAQIAQIRRNDKVPHIPDESDASDTDDVMCKPPSTRLHEANMRTVSGECEIRNEEQMHVTPTITPATTIIDVDALDADITAQLQASMPSDGDDVCVTPFARIRKRKRDHSSDSAHTRPFCVDEENIGDLEADIEAADKDLIRGLPQEDDGHVAHFPSRSAESNATLHDYG